MYEFKSNYNKNRRCESLRVTSHLNPQSDMLPKFQVLDQSGFLVSGTYIPDSSR